MGQYDITIASSNPSPEFSTASYRIAEDYQQDITPASTRRSDGDARYKTIETESFWSQGDWSGGFGLVYPPDPTSYQDGPADALTPKRLKAPYAATTATLTNGARIYRQVNIFANSLHTIFGLSTDDASSHTLAYFDTNTSTWTAAVVLPAKATCLAAFRGKIWIGYGAANAVQTWDGTTLVTVTTNFYADALAGFGSMVFTLTHDTSTSTMRINRHDPENTGANPDLAIFPLKFDTVANYRLCPLGADLYCMVQGQLWKFTSTTGNTGVLAGPLDEFSAQGGSGADRSIGAGLTSYQGALYYTAGRALRRYVPGGQPRQIWPDPARSVTPDASVDDDIWDLEVAEDRLWLAMVRSVAPTATYTTEPCRLLCWDGVGMHHVGSLTGVWTTSPPSGSSGATLCSDGNGLLTVCFNHKTNPTSSGRRNGFYKIGGALGRLYLDDGVVKFSRQDFGLLDIEKSLSQIGVAAIVPSGQDIGVTVVVDNTSYAMVKQGSFSTTFPTIVYFTPPSSARVIVGKIHEIRLTFDLGAATSASTPEVWTVLAVPNPLNPLRRGFRFTILLDTSVADHTTGGLVYADDTAISTALAAVRAYRAPTTTRHPIALTWVDGITYYVRFNTLTVRRSYTQAGTHPAYRVIIDAQEVS